MDKSRICMSRTINLAKQNAGKTSNLLAYEKGNEPPKPCPKKKFAVTPAKAKRIRVCTGAELKRMCPPPPCICPERAERIGAIARLFSIIRFGLKSALAGSMVYFTWDAGLWGDSEDTEEFYTNVCHMLTEHKLRQQRKLSKSCEVELELIQVPPVPEDTCTRAPIDKERSLQRAKENWNSVVTSFFQFVVGFPYNVIDWYQRTFSEECTRTNKKQD